MAKQGREVDTRQGKSGRTSRDGHCKAGRTGTGIDRENLAQQVGTYLGQSGR